MNNDTMTEKVSQKTKVEESEDNIIREEYVLQLFIAGLVPNSVRAITNIREICERFLKGRYKLKIIDIYDKPSFAIKEDIIAMPLLIKRLPLPEARLIGDLSNMEKVLKGLDII
jgi:circadian clock protein KaiB